jgi:hypothetical protein
MALRHNRYPDSAIGLAAEQRDHAGTWGSAVRCQGHEPKSSAPARRYHNRLSYSALNSQPSSAITASRYIHTSSTMPAATLPYSTL